MGQGHGIEESGNHMGLSERGQGLAPSTTSYLNDLEQNP